MSGDLVSLRMIIVSAYRPMRELWRQGAALATVPIEIIDADASEARAALLRGGADIVVLDSDLSEADRNAAIGTARKIHPPPYIAMACPPGHPRPDGVGVLAKPSTAEDARREVARCVRMRLPTRVLVVDDSGTMRSIVRKILLASRYTMDISEASEGIAALNHLGTQKVDVVMLDYNMPGFNGIETLAEIKRVAPRVAVVMMTSTVDDVVRARAESSGAAGFLKKPFYPADLDTILDRIYDSE